MRWNSHLPCGGSNSLKGISSTDGSTAVGACALEQSTGSNNTAVGYTGPQIFNVSTNTYYSTTDSSNNYYQMNLADTTTITSTDVTNNTTINSLKNVIIGTSVTSLSDNGFANCTNLASVILQMKI